MRKIRRPFFRSGWCDASRRCSNHTNHQLLSWNLLWIYVSDLIVFTEIMQFWQLGINRNDKFHGVIIQFLFVLKQQINQSFTSLLKVIFKPSSQINMSQLVSSPKTHYKCNISQNLTKILPFFKIPVRSSCPRYHRCCCQRWIIGRNRIWCRFVWGWLRLRRWFGLWRGFGLRVGWRPWVWWILWQTISSTRP